MQALNFAVMPVEFTCRDACDNFVRDVAFRQRRALRPTT
jgi:hypothetical protein